MNIHIKSVFENVIVDDKNKQIEEKDKYIKTLKEDIEICRIQSNYFIDRSDDLEKEVDRLNNIIAKIKTFLKNRIKYVPETMAEVYEDELILNQLNELEEGNYEK